MQTARLCIYMVFLFIGRLLSGGLGTTKTNPLLDISKKINRVKKKGLFRNTSIGAPSGSDRA